MWVVSLKFSKSWLEKKSCKRKIKIESLASLFWLCLKSEASEGVCLGKKLNTALKTGVIFWRELSENLDLDASSFEKVYMSLKSEKTLVYKLMARFF